MDDRQNGNRRRGGIIILDALKFGTSTIVTLIFLVAYFRLVNKVYKYLMTIDPSYLTGGIAFLAGVMFTLLFADNSSRVICILRLLIIFTALCYFGSWIYALSFEDITSWKALNFHIVMLGIVLTLLSFCFFYELRKFLMFVAHLQKQVAKPSPAEHN